MQALKERPVDVGFDRHTLFPGDVACGRRGDHLETLLGSCIAVVLTDPRRTAGAMCHIVHPGRAASAQGDDTAHVDGALAAMATGLRSLGLLPRLCEAYVYGGGNMFPRIYPEGTAIGERTAQQVLGRLSEAGVRLLHLDVGGTAFRRLAWTIGPDAPRVTAVEV